MRRIKFVWLCFFSDFIDWLIEKYQDQIEAFDPTDVETAFINKENVGENSPKQYVDEDATGEIDMEALIRSEIESQIDQLNSNANLEMTEFDKSVPTLADYKNSEDGVEFIYMSDVIKELKKIETPTLTLIHGGREITDPTLSSFEEMSLVDEVNKTKPDYKIN